MKEKKLAYPKNFFEKNAWKNNFFVCGIDEVGRGCLAGPVLVAAVIMPQNSFHELLIDSKKLSSSDRELAYNWIINNCEFTVATACNKNIDNNNIYKSTQQTMQKAYSFLLEKISFPLEKLNYLLTDAMPLNIDKKDKHENLSIHNFNYGESISSTIAAASIVAKVTRDRMMNDIDLIFPRYGFKQHKGYGTKKHLDAIQMNGASIIHRQSFLSNIQTTSNQVEIVLQKTLFGSQ